MDSSRRAFIKRAIGVGASTAATGVASESGALCQAPGVRGFNHVALPMQNVDAMVAFYRALGFRVDEGARSARSVSAHR